MRDLHLLVASAVLLVAAYPPFHLLLPSFTALIPLAVWIERRVGEEVGGRTVLHGAAVFGFAYWGLLLHWMPVSLFRFAPGLLPAWPIAVALLAAISAAAVGSAWRLRRKLVLPLWLALPLAWTAGDWLRGHLPASLAFPWLGLGTSLTGYPELVGFAEVVGARGVAFWLVLVNALLASAWSTFRAPGMVAGSGPPRTSRRSVLRLTAAALVVAVPVGWGLMRARSLETRPALTVAVVRTQLPGGPRGERWTAADSGLVVLDRMLTRLADPTLRRARPTDATPPAEGGRGRGSSGPDLVVFPEALLPVRLEGDRARSLTARLDAAVDSAGLPVLLGALGVDPRGPGSEDDVPYNSAFLIRPDSVSTRGPARPGGAGAPSYDRYDKRHLVAFVERVPFAGLLGRLPGGPGAGTDDGGRGGNYGVGTEARPFRIAGVGVGVLICWESAFPQAARRLVSEGADVLVNLTSDAWLDGSDPWSRTVALRQHPAHLVMRAVETRTGVARSANGGVSLFVDPLGTVYGELTRTGAAPETEDPMEDAVRVAPVRTTDGETAFVRWGDLVGRSSVVLTGLLLLGSVVSGRSPLGASSGHRNRTDPGPPRPRHTDPVTG